MPPLLRRAAWALAAALACATVGLIHGIPAAPAGSSPPSWTHWKAPLPQIIEGARVSGTWLFKRLWPWARHHPHAATWVSGIALILIVGNALYRSLPRRSHKDPRRLFTTDERRVGFNLAGERCEMDGLFFRRCSRPAEQGDHWLPHSKGGATSMTNFVALCGRCNRAKSNTWPSFWQTLRIEHRRRSYYPAGMTLRPHGTYRG